MSLISYRVDMSSIGASVAPLAGSVDRNNISTDRQTGLSRSLPSRGAWIEIIQLEKDWNSPESLPSRGAWIEISLGTQEHRESKVAPLAGSVDRNTHVVQALAAAGRRSPRGERG